MAGAVAGSRRTQVEPGAGSRRAMAGAVAASRRALVEPGAGSRRAQMEADAGSTRAGSAPAWAADCSEKWYSSPSAPYAVWLAKR